jgi:tRNA threonylcarbamoyladenosine biosynthesis protein TsaE
VIALFGDLGTGKTRFVKGVCEFFGAKDHVSSPSFIILNRYGGVDEKGEELLLHHVDLYRVKTLDEIYDLGYEEFFYGDGITLIEWAEQLGELLPPRRYEIRLDYGTADTERRISFELVELSAQRSKQNAAGVR